MSGPTVRPCAPPPSCTHKSADGWACRPCRDAALAHWAKHPVCQAEVRTDTRGGHGRRWCGAPARYIRQRVIVGFTEFTPLCRAHRCENAKLDHALWAHGCYPEPNGTEVKP